ncbi:HNH endonuclease [archaeon]|nr:HNH endonuclease [archaeon]
MAKCRKCKTDISKTKFVMKKGYCDKCYDRIKEQEEIEEEKEEKKELIKREEKIHDIEEKLVHFIDKVDKIIEKKNQSAYDQETMLKYLDSVYDYSNEILDLCGDTFESPFSLYGLALYYRWQGIIKDSRRILNKALDYLDEALELNPIVELKYHCWFLKLIIADELDDTDLEYECEKKIEELEKEIKKKGGKIVNDKGYIEQSPKKHSELEHRQNAYHYIYLKNRDKYPLPFSQYVVHHKDGNKLNNHSRNLELFTKEEHAGIHRGNHPHNPFNKNKTTHKSRSKGNVKAQRRRYKSRRK